MSEDPKEYSFSSKIIHGQSVTPAWDYSRHVVPPISSSSAFRLENVERGASGFVAFGTHPLGTPGEPLIYIYDRLAEPCGMMLQQRLADAEGGEIAVAFGSGMAAITAAILFDIKAGDHILADSTLYGCTYSLLVNWLTRFGIEVTLVDFSKADAIEKNFKKNTRVVYFETPTNPSLVVHDIAEISKKVKELSKGRAPEQRCRIIVDNTFATPYCQRPLSLGADLVVNSLTKNINGFGTDTGGVVIGSGEDEQKLMLWRKDFGAVLSPKSAWNHLVYGLPTLEVRTLKQQQTSFEVAKFLQDHPQVESVQYIGLPSHPQYEIARKQMVSPTGEFAPGGMIYFKLKGKDPLDCQNRAVRFINLVAKDSYCVTLAVSLGQVRTLIEHPSSMTHAVIPPEEQVKAGIDPSGIRLSIGLESALDLIRDLDMILAESAKG